MKVAFIGLANMGEPMALNLVRAGHELTVYNRTRGKTDRLAKEGARVADSPVAAVRGAEVAIIMLANDQAVRDAMLVPAQQAGAAIDALPNGAIHTCTSTISVALSKELAESHAARSQGYVAAPFGGAEEAVDRRRRTAGQGGALPSADGGDGPRRHGNGRAGVAGQSHQNRGELHARFAAGSHGASHRADAQLFSRGF